MTARHITKDTHEDGKELHIKRAWCGQDIRDYDWAFVDTHHAALAVGGSIQPCKRCVKAIIKQFENEL